MSTDQATGKANKSAGKPRKWSPSSLLYVAVPEAELCLVSNGKVKATEARFLADIKTFTENWWIHLHVRQRPGCLRIECRTTLPKGTIPDEVFGELQVGFKQALDEVIRELPEPGHAERVDWYKATDFGEWFFRITFVSLVFEGNFRPLQSARDNPLAAEVSLEVETTSTADILRLLDTLPPELLLDKLKQIEQGRGPKEEANKQPPPMPQPEKSLDALTWQQREELRRERLKTKISRQELTAAETETAPLQEAFVFAFKHFSMISPGAKPPAKTATGLQRQFPTSAVDGDSF